MATEISPVTESEMRDFFDRVVNAWVGKTQEVQSLNEHVSQQEQAIGNLRQSLDDIKSQLAALSDENGRLKESEKQAWDMANTAADREREAISRRDQAEANAKALQDSIIARDSRVSELEQLLQAAQAERDTLREENSRLHGENDNLSGQLASNRDLISNLEGQNSSLRSERDEAQRSLADIRSVFDRMQQAAQGWQPSVVASSGG